MRKAWFRRLGLAAVAGLALAGTATGATGCASPREEINRVQPNVIRKNDLVGDFRNKDAAPEFYQRNLILEVHRTNPWFSDGLQDLTRRIRFEITENFLIARNAYEYLPGADGHGGAAGKTNNGAVVGMWPITSHFTIQRSYNPVTGEETNVLEENSTDLRWYERDHMRVDWSANLASDPNGIYWWDQIGGDIVPQPVPFYENDPNKPNASHFEEMGTGYFDITSRFLMKPANVHYWGMDVPWCLIANMRLHPQAHTEGTYECSDQEVTIRTSFAKVPTGPDSSDYEVAEVDGQQGNIMGNLTLDRSGYDRVYGPTDATWHRYIQRYNLWGKSHDARVCGDAPGAKQSDGNAQCAGVTAEDDAATAAGKLGKSNSMCDMNVKLCTLPYKDRPIKPVAFYADTELPKEMWEPTQHSVDQWDTTLSRAIAYGREAECRKDGGEREACHEKYFNGPIDVTKEDEPKLESKVVVLCHNPVVATDNKACGQAGKKVVKGDVRHHMIAWWKNPSINNPLGVIVWSGDPTTGENIGSLVNVFGASVQSYSSRARDYIQLINGDVTPAEYAAGKPADWYMEGNLQFSNDVVTDPVLNSYSSMLQTPKTGAMSKDEIAARLKAVNIKETAARLGLANALKGTSTPAERVAAMQAHVAKQSTLGTPGFGDGNQYAAKLGAKMDVVKKHGFESKIFNDQWVKAVDINPDYANNPAVLNAMSPLGTANPTAIAQAIAKDFEAKRAKHMCSLEMEEGLNFAWMSGYSAKLKARYPDGAVATGKYAKAAGVEGQTIDRIVRGKIIFQELLAPTYEFTLLHEMGHLMSMEHDFPASWDSPNFRTEYWTLRANGKKENMVECGDEPRKPGAPDTCMGPRWIDPATTDELGTTKGKEHDSIDAYADSSVMDYKFDTIYAPSLGPFDKMAAKFIYTRMVETFDDEKYSLIKNSKGVGTQFLPTLAGLNSERWIVGTGYAHYTDMARKLNLFDPARCRPQTPEENANGIGALGLVCAPVHKDHAFLRDMKDELPKGGFPEFFRTFYSREKAEVPGTTGKSRWPYKAGDGRLSYVHNYYYDNGADFYEITQDALELYDLKYLDYFYRKGAREVNTSGAGRAMYGRFFDRVQSLQWNAISDVARETLGGAIDPGAFSGPEDKARLLSLTMLFDGMQKSLLRPQPGAYVATKPTGGLYDLYTQPEAGSPTGDFKLSIGDSRYIDNEYDLTKVYDYQAYIKRAGSFLEKPYASIALTDARPQLSTVARETYLDGRNVMYSFRSAIPAAFDRLIAGVMADDWDTIAPYVDPKDADLPGVDKGFKPMHTMKLWEDDVTKIVRPAGAKLIDPMLGYRTKVPAMFLMLLFQPIDSDMQLINRTRIWVEGSKEAIKIPDAEKIVFFDPVEGTPWAAKSFGKEKIAGKVGDIGIGARMLEHANELLMAAFNVETEVVDAASGQKKVKYVDGRPVKLGGGNLTGSDIKDANAAAKLRAYVGFMNETRQLLIYLGYGPCGRGEEC